MLSKEKLVFDPSAVADGDAVGAFVRSADGTLITHTTVGTKQALDVNVANAIRITDGTNDLAINPDGSINVDVSLTTGAEKAEDSAHSDGDIGQFILAVRQDTLASSVSADGDYAALKVNNVGALWVQIANSNLPVTQSGMTNALVSQVNVGTTAAPLLSTPLSQRKRILIQNVSSNRTAYLGHNGSVTASNGIRLSPGAAIELDVAPAVNLHAIASAAGCDLRIMELA